MARGNVRLVVHTAAVRQLLNSPEVRADITRRADAVAGAAGPGHRVEVGSTGRRVRAAVITDTWQARYREATERSLTSAVDAGR